MSIDEPSRIEEVPNVQEIQEDYKDLLLKAKNEMNSENFGTASRLYGRALELMYGIQACFL